MSFEIPQQNNKPELQKTMNFEDAAIEFALKQKQQALDEINRKYPEAKIPIHLVDGDEINGYKVKGETLEEYARDQHMLYSRSDEKSERNAEYRNGQN